MTTRRQLIHDKYTELYKNMSPLFDVNIVSSFPSPENVDISVLVMNISLYFGNPETYKRDFMNLLNVYNVNISDEAKETAYVHFHHFLLWFSTLM